MPHKKSHRYLFGNGEIAELIFCLFPRSTLTGADQGRQLFYTRLGFTLTLISLFLHILCYNKLNPSSKGA